MGFDTNGVKCLLAAKANGVCFRKAVTIGRQRLHLNFKELGKNLGLFNFDKTHAEIKSLLSEEDGYSEPLLRMLGAKEVCSIDASPYEGASLIHDMNLPISGALRESFTLVIDSGSLEHIFDFPQAIKNCMEMVQIGGHFLGITPANNFMGHGFYQFSPELYFAIFTENNGFLIDRMILFEASMRAKWYEVTKPEKGQRRAEIVNKYKTYIFIQAKKIDTVQIFSSTPQQNDYLELWKEFSNDTSKRHCSYSGNYKCGNKKIQKTFGRIKGSCPELLKIIYRVARRAAKPRFDPESFKKIKSVNLMKTAIDETE